MASNTLVSILETKERFGEITWRSREKNMNNRQQFIHPRDAIVQTMARIYRYRMTTTSGGNLSVRDENGDIWISPARVDKGNLTRNDVVCVKADGSVEGSHPPSSQAADATVALGLLD